jgi:hypothetical protein
MAKKSFIDRIWENKDEFDKVETYPYSIDEDKVVERRDELNNVDYYVPLLLLRFVDLNYYDNVSDKVKSQLMKAHKLHRYVGVDLVKELLDKDFLMWIEEHKEWEDIVIKE